MSDLDGREPTELLARLLGPAGPELTCDECFEQLDRYVELELELDRHTADAGPTSPRASSRRWTASRAGSEHARSLHACRTQCCTEHA